MIRQSLQEVKFDYGCEENWKENIAGLEELQYVLCSSCELPL
eukprot:CAMPEP_0202493910 /NCGR_PEP_ID=MMETSP1361-20130828/10059_1 /ASSEMBLY_ACC=CAM_ASM_000849 /TAXON_ID=210615 /ORGANISM="Staurosira complex sp., Strain CCMP2646" /LENGTH=41 /DNA_ID= /DNA_START= /DNA_END= /DNA_ORIENTATION=